MNRSEDICKAWLSQALSVFHSCGIPLEKDLAVYELFNRDINLFGSLVESKSQQRRQQPIYLFVYPPPLDLFDGIRTDGRGWCYTSFLHHWSFHADGRSPLSAEICSDFGLPFELKISNTHDFSSYSLPTEYYKLIHRYQVFRGVDPTTTDFACPLGYGFKVQPVSDSDRFAEVYEKQDFYNPKHADDSASSSNSENSSDTHGHGPASIVKGQIIGEMESCHHLDQDGTASNDQTMEEEGLQPLPATTLPCMSTPNLHSLKHAYSQQQCQSQVYPRSYNGNEENFPYPHLSETTQSVDAPLGAAPTDHNSLPRGRTPDGWPETPQYISNKSDEFSQIGVPQVAVTSRPCGTGTAEPPNLGYTNPLVDTTTVAPESSDYTAQSIGWSGPSESATTNDDFEGYPMEVDTDTVLPCPMDIE
ncbi:hypothetical protein PM082_009267 [Marasmius tenuissimus]|nr:hypothetical protein PM082_009267 [Marasmius tenuissimus]